MKRKRFLLSLVLILSIVTLSMFNFTKDTAQAASAAYINDSTFTLEVDHYRTVVVHGTSGSVYWSSSNSRVASVSGGGKVTGIAPGTATITASVAGKKLTCKVTVLMLNKKNLTLTPGKSGTLTVSGPQKEVTWSTSDGSIATVSSTGTVTAIAPGNAVITATVDGKDVTGKVSVIGLNYSSIALEYNGPFGFVKTLKVTGASGKVTWTSSDKAIAAVDSDGEVWAKGPGTATVTAYVDGYKLICKVRILEMSDAHFTMKLGQTKTLNILGTSDKITWQSNKKSVATVSSNGTVTPVATGKAMIMAFVDGREVRAWVTVK